MIYFFAGVFVGSALMAVFVMGGRREENKTTKG